MAFFKHSKTPQDATGAGSPGGTLFADVNLRLVNRLLGVVTVLLAVAAAYRVSMVDSSISLPSPSPSDGQPAERAMNEFKSEKEYIAPVAAHDLFRVREFERTSEEEKDTVKLEQQQVRARLEELKGRLMVVGVSWREPRLVMLYDKRNRETYFLRESDMIGDSDIKVTEIKRRKIKIGLQDEEIDL